MNFMESLQDLRKSQQIESASQRCTPSLRLSNELHEVVQSCEPNATLSKRLQAELESCNRESRRDIVQHIRSGSTPLFTACRRGCVSIVEYLATVCEADIEHKCCFEVYIRASTYIVTPLWCAAVSNDFPMVKCLLRLGSDINSTSQNGSTPVFHTCSEPHVDMVKFLVENGADIRKPNRNGTTCLMNSVKFPELCLFLIQKGCDVNAVDAEGKTAVHYAIKKCSLKTIKLLLEHGANPYVINQHGDDALQMACLKGAHEIFKYLTNNVEFSVKRLAEAHELIGATFWTECNNLSEAIMHWRSAHYLRSENPYIEKLPKVPLRAAYCFQREFTTLEELDNISVDINDMRIQSLLIYERVLGITHEDLLLRLGSCGASYADSLQFQHCIHLWTLLLETRVQQDTLVSYKASTAAQSLVELMIDVNEQKKSQMYFSKESLPQFKDVLAVFKLLTDTIVECHALVQIPPISARQKRNFDTIFKCIVFTIYLLISSARTRDEALIVCAEVRKLIHTNIRSACANDSLLHVCVSKLIVIRARHLKALFPNVRVAMLLLKYGIDVNGKNKFKSTPLHIVTQPYNYNIEVIKILLNHGADLDQPNKSGERPYNLILRHRLKIIPLVNYINLKCLAATAISKHCVPYHNQLPKCLEKFVRDHEP